MGDQKASSFLATVSATEAPASYRRMYTKYLHCMTRRGGLVERHTSNKCHLILWLTSDFYQEQHLDCNPSQHVSRRSKSADSLSHLSLSLLVTCSSALLPPLMHSIVFFSHVSIFCCPIGFTDPCPRHWMSRKSWFFVSVDQRREEPGVFPRGRYVSD